MGRRTRSPEEQERRAKIRELLQLSNVSSMEDIQNLFKETIAEFTEDGLDAELFKRVNHLNVCFLCPLEITVPQREKNTSYHHKNGHRN